MPCLISLDGFGKKEGSPISQSADDASVGEDEGAGGAGESEQGRC